MKDDDDSQTQGTYIRLVQHTDGNFHVAIKKTQEGAVYCALKLLHNRIRRGSFNFRGFLDGCLKAARDANQPQYAQEIGHEIMIEIVSIYGGMDFIDGEILMKKGVICKGIRFHKMDRFVKDTIEGDTITVREEDL